MRACSVKTRLITWTNQPLSADRRNRLTCAVWWRLVTLLLVHALTNSDRWRGQWRHCTGRTGNSIMLTCSSPVEVVLFICCWDVSQYTVDWRYLKTTHQLKTINVQIICTGTYPYISAQRIALYLNLDKVISLDVFIVALRRTRETIQPLKIGVWDHGLLSRPVGG